MKTRNISKPVAVLLMLWTALLAVSTSALAAPLNLIKRYPDFYVGGMDFSFDATTRILTVGRVENNAAAGGDNDWMCEEGETCTGTSTVNSYSAGPSPSPQLQVTNYPITTGTGARPNYKENFSLYAKLDTSGNVLEGTFKIDGVVRTFTGNPTTTGCPSFVLNTYSCVLYDGTLDTTGTGGLLSGSLAKFGWIGTSAFNGTLEFTFDNADGIIAGLGYHGGGMKLYVVGATGTGFTDFNTQALTKNWSTTGAAGYGDVFVPIPAAMWLFGSGALALLGVARRKSRH